MKRIFQTKVFSGWMRKNGLSKEVLYKAVLEMSEGLIEANLGGNVFKKRIGLPGRGETGGARTIVATKMADRWFFLYGFNKNERSNISKEELRIFQELAGDLLEFDEKELMRAISAREIEELYHDH